LKNSRAKTIAQRALVVFERTFGAVDNVRVTVPPGEFSEGFLGLGQPPALALLLSTLQLPEVFRPALGDLLPTLPRYA
jgi:hypothetical protein